MNVLVGAPGSGSRSGCRFQVVPDAPSVGACMPSVYCPLFVWLVWLGLQLLTESIAVYFLQNHANHASSLRHLSVLRFAPFSSGLCVAVTLRSVL